MIKKLYSRYTSWQAVRRDAARREDVHILWPRIWLTAEGNTLKFLEMANRHTRLNPAWTKPGEWRGTAADPAQWVAKHLAQQRSRET